MAEVSGTIGNEQVTLNNAATEATLRLLLQATLSANKQTVESVSKIATKAGLDPNAVSAANKNLGTIGVSAQQGASSFYKLGFATGTVEQGFRNVDAAITPMISKFMEGTSKASDVFDQFKRIGGPIGFVADMFGRLARFQEQNLQTYQQLSQSGVNFNGSLTQMRMAAQNSYMTLDEFTRVMKANSTTFAQMGGTVNDGAMAFTRLSNSLLKSEAGDYLRNLGYTSEQVNQGLAGYLAASGGRNKQELQNTAAITKGATEYLTQLDALSEITGKTREEQEKALKEANANAAYEAYLQTLDEEGKKKATLAMQNALATGGKAGSDLLKSQLLGLPPMTEAAQKLQALGPNVANGIKQMGDAVGDTRKTTQDVEKGRAAAQAGANKDMEKFGKTAGALSFGTDSTSQAMMGLQQSVNRNKQQGIKTQEDAENQMKSVVDKQKERAESEAANAVKTQKSIQETGQTIMSALMPAIQMLTPAITSIVRGFGWVVEKLVEFKTVTLGITAALLAWWTFQKVQNIQERVNAAKAAGGKGLLGGLGVGGALGNVGALGSKTNPMYVIVVGGGGAGGLGDILGEKGKPGGGLSKASMAKNLLKGGAGLVGGMALGYAGDKLKESGHEKLGAGADIAGGALTGASTGAMIGSFIGPLGTIIGGALGGVVGGGMQLYDNWDKLAGKDVPKHALGGIATKPSIGMIGEGKEPEAILPLSKLKEMLGTMAPVSGGLAATAGNAISSMLGGMGGNKGIESLSKEIETLNKNTIDMLKQLKDIADHSKQNVSATKSLSGNLFNF